MVTCNLFNPELGNFAIRSSNSYLRCDLPQNWINAQTSLPVCRERSRDVAADASQNLQWTPLSPGPPYFLFYIAFYEVIIHEVSLDLSSLQVCNLWMKVATASVGMIGIFCLVLLLLRQNHRWKRSFLFTPWKGSKKTQRKPSKWRWSAFFWNSSCRFCLLVPATYCQFCQYSLVLCKQADCALHTLWWW
jgi:hypothetical protein